MKKVKVIVKDKTILELVENASIGDLIDLNELTQIDYTSIEQLIENGKDKVYASKLNEYKEKIYAEQQLKISESTNQIEKKYLEEISKLQSEITILKNSKETEIKNILESEKDKQNRIKEDNINELKMLKLELENQYSSKLSLKDKELLEQKLSFEKELKEKEEIINNLQRTKASLNVKQTGEDLESWCDNEVASYMQNGLYNCTWTKDNKVVKNENETKGSKADYIFKIYASDKHQSDELLASVCLEMKDENPESVNKKNNSDYYKQLDKNRIKKECKYAVLVSNLERDNPNILPIYKVREYENMYVVRPAYMMVFLNMLTSLTTRFVELILEQAKQSLELKDKKVMLEEFEKIKKKILDAPLESLTKSIDEIVKSSEAIQKATKKIDEQCDYIKKKYISEIEEKLKKFTIK